MKDAGAALSLFPGGALLAGGVGHAQAAVLDAVRRAQGDALEALGFGPVECAHRVVAAGPGWRLRAYGGEGRRVLIVAAPIKRPYVWDLSPPVSAVRHLLDQGLSVHLLEWTPPTPHAAQAGLDEYVEAIGASLAEIGHDGGAPVLIGHSLGGSLAAIFAAFAPHGLGGLVLLSAPLCFGEGVSAFRDRLVAMARIDPTEGRPAPGSVLTQASVLASPEAFIWTRLTDMAASLTDPRAMGVHARVERWALDEVPLSGKLTGQILGWLYREDRFFRGILPVKGRAVGPRDLSVPILAVVDAADEITPSAAVKPFLDAAPADSRLLEYAGETGVGLQHLALLIGRQARSLVWPEIFAWIDARR